MAKEQIVNNFWKQNLILFLLVLALVLYPLVTLKNAEFEGADGQAQELATKIKADYQPWFQSLWEPPTEIASLLFALQAAIGAGFIGYYLGFSKGRKRQEEK